MLRLFSPTASSGRRRLESLDAGTRRVVSGTAELCHQVQETQTILVTGAQDREASPTTEPLALKSANRRSCPASISTSATPAGPALLYSPDDPGVPPPPGGAASSAWSCRAATSGGQTLRAMVDVFEKRGHACA